MALEHLSFIALGSNLAPRWTYLRQAHSLLTQALGNCLAVSSCYETPAWGPITQGPYLNAVLAFELETHTAQSLLSLLLELEQACGRVRLERWGPRTLDLDLLAHGQNTCHSETLTLPHPRLAQRRFVLEPWAEIAPTWSHPSLGTTIADLLNRCPDQTPALNIYTDWTSNLFQTDEPTS